MAADADSSTIDDQWIARLAEASAGLEDPGDRSAVVAVTIGKKQKAVLDITDGRVTGPGDDGSVAVTVPVTGEQLAAFVDGSESVAQAYMRGDLKPVGSTGAFLAVVELFENPSFRAALSTS
ncbi:MAG: SCP2 sterol-binding domain-containing protein [Acidimicrobiales bacterium]